MSKFETTLRQIIYHYSQNTLPINVAKEHTVIYTLPSGRKIEFSPIRMGDDISVDDRIELCKDILLPRTISFFNDLMRDEYYQMFCIENLEREIEYETTTYFLMKWKSNIKKSLFKYNTLYKLLSGNIDFLYDYERHVQERTNDDTLQTGKKIRTGAETFTHGLRMVKEFLNDENLYHGLTTENTFSAESDLTHGLQTTNTYNSDSSLIHGLKVETDNTSTTENKVVFEDTPENELLNQNYATAITKTGDENILDGETRNSGTDKTEKRGVDSVANSGIDKTENSGSDITTNSGVDRTNKTGEESVVNSGTDTRTYDGITDSENAKIEKEIYRIMDEYGHNRSIPEIVNEIAESRINVIESMVEETSRGLFIKVY